MKRRRIVLFVIPCLTAALLFASLTPATDPILEGYKGSYPEQSTMVYKTGPDLEIISSLRFEPNEADQLKKHLEDLFAESKGYKWTPYQEYDLTTIEGHGQKITARLDSNPPQISVYRKCSKQEFLRLWMRCRGNIRAYEVRSMPSGGTTTGPGTVPVWKMLIN